MQKTILALFGFAILGLSGCGDTMLERGATGAAIGAGAALVLDEDPLTGAAVGGTIGVITN